jgi:hypothetical protein
METGEKFLNQATFESRVADSHSDSSPTSLSLSSEAQETTTACQITQKNWTQDHSMAPYPDPDIPLTEEVPDQQELAPIQELFNDSSSDQSLSSDQNAIDYRMILDNWEEDELTQYVRLEAVPLAEIENRNADEENVEEGGDEENSSLKVRKNRNGPKVSRCRGDFPSRELYNKFRLSCAVYNHLGKLIQYGQTEENHIITLIEFADRTYPLLLERTVFGEREMLEYLSPVGYEWNRLVEQKDKEYPNTERDYGDNDYKNLQQINKIGRWANNHV